MKKTPKLFIPGPTFVPFDVLNSLVEPQIGHRTKEFSDLMLNIVEGIKKLLYTDNNIYLTSHPATGLWEMGVKNSVRKGVLHAVNGAFSAKWADVSEDCGYNVGKLEYDWGKGIKVDDLDKMLSSGNYDVFCMVHNETSTGVMTNLEPIAELLRIKYPEIIWQVDAVSSMAGSRIEVDKLGIDFIFASTQKAWGLPAGFSMCAVSDRLIALSKNIINKGYFFDIMIYEKYYNKMQTPFTPSIPHMYGLKYVLENIIEEGLDNRWIRHIENAKLVRKWALNKGQSLFPELGFESNTITCIQNDLLWDIDQINIQLLDRGFRIDRGYGKLRGKAFRISHMGNIYKKDIEEFLINLDEVLNV